MITLEQFKSTLSDIKLFQIAEELINRGFAKLGQDSRIIMSKPEEVVVRLLEIIFNDKGQWIQYFLYELDWGKKYKDGCITDVDGSYIHLSTIDELYDFLLKEAEDENIYS